MMASRPKDIRTVIDRKIIFTVLSVIILSQLVYLFISVQSFKNEYHKNISNNFITVGDSLSGNLNEILQKGVPLDKLFGLQSLFSEVIRNSPDLESIVVQDKSGKALYFSDPIGYKSMDELEGDGGIYDDLSQKNHFSFPLKDKNGEICGNLSLVIDNERINENIREIALDTGTIILISILAILDFLFFMVALTVPPAIKSLSSGKIQKSGIRNSTESFGTPVLITPAIFLFVFAESLSISFLPLFARQMYTPLLSLPEEVAIGLPVSAFMLFTAISMPLGGSLTERLGLRKCYVVGALLSATGLFLTSFAFNLELLILFRALAGSGFGLVFMSAQGYIVNQTTTANRAEGMAIFLTAFYVGTLCGSAFGGVVAERVGFRPLFMVGAVISILSMIFLYYIKEETSAASKPDKNRPKDSHSNIKTIISFLKDRNFVALTILQAIPNKICLIGFIYYLAPLLLNSMGCSQSDTGRYIMCYSLMMIILGQPLSRLSDKKGKPVNYIFWGGILSGSALLLCYFLPGKIWVASGILMLGFAHSFSVSNQGKMASQLKVIREAGTARGLGFYRQIERTGNVIAPIILGLLAAKLGYTASLAVIGLFTIISTILFGCLYNKNEQ